MADTFNASSQAKFKLLQNRPTEIDIKSCYFYHTMDLPDYGLIPGDWDLRGREDDLLGAYDFSGKTILDVGTATGYLCFEMIKRGGHVAALDQDENADSDFAIIPYFDYAMRFGMTFEDRVAATRKLIVESRNAFLLAQRCFGVEAPIYLGDVVRDAPPMDVDAAFFGNILLHLRDPIGALLNVARSTREAVIVSELVIDKSIGLDAPPYVLFRPSLTPPSTSVTWWYLSPAVVRSVLEVAGFKRFDLTFGGMLASNGHDAPIYNLTAYRN